MRDAAERLPGIAERVAWPRHVDEAGKSAVLSACRDYRYGLFRIWNPDRPVAMFVGLNPSTADEFQDDPTIRRCVRFARDWRYGGLIMANLYAYRATDPDELARVDDPVGPEANEWLCRLRERAGLVVAAWGGHHMARHRAGHVLALLGDVHTLGLTAGGEPRHPLYLRAATQPTPWIPS